MKRINYFIQSIIYLLGASLYQTNVSIRQNEGLTWIEHFGIAFLVFGLMSWLLLTGVLHLIERKKPADQKSNTAMWLGIGFIAIFLLV